ncbi:carboxylating nicotinate-nucleotide diphosphorylase [Alkalibacillus sp. S2W]|uniref:carboxylating nicotinate-nucleotide diphosphorylase n=1 Tax=Alkalibacillus sp. S2W TaxID=3386553 RepID=UPI00398D54C7
MNKLKLKQILTDFFNEDIGEYDVTTDHLFNEHDRSELMITAKESGIFCGESIIYEGYTLLDDTMHIELLVRDGEKITPGDAIAYITGPINTLLKGERVILNMIQRLSGIATTTAQAVENLNDHHIRISDTRKTTPGLRMLEKYAVRVGGGVNHRLRLDDAVLIKDNHIAFFGSIQKAIRQIRRQIGHMIKIEVEIDDKEQLLEAIEADVDVIMIDNTDITTITDWVKLIPDSITIELSGGITPEDLSQYRGLPIDIISMGYLTHHIQALDLSATHQPIKERV